MEHPGSPPGHDDPYEALGVSAGASQRDIARAYRRAAQRAHPDTQPMDPQATARFRDLTDAYDMLSDPVRRAAYDRSHPAAQAGPPSARPARPADSGGGQGLGGSRHAPGWPRPRPFLLMPEGPGAGPPADIAVGPVHIEPPAAGPSAAPSGDPPPGGGRASGGGRAAAEFEDPAVVLGTVRDGRWGWWR